MVRVIERFLTGLGYKVALNKPYAGGYITERYGVPSDSLHTLQIEVNRALYMDEETLALRRDFRNLRANLTSLASVIVHTLPAFLSPRRAAAE
jgi:N-formylglutamate amidohydrolase